MGTGLSNSEELEDIHEAPQPKRQIQHGQESAKETPPVPYAPKGYIAKHKVSLQGCDDISADDLKCNQSPPPPLPFSTHPSPSMENLSNKFRQS